VRPRHAENWSFVVERSAKRARGVRVDDFCVDEKIFDGLRPHALLPQELFDVTRCEHAERDGRFAKTHRRVSRLLGEHGEDLCAVEEPLRERDAPDRGTERALPRERSGDLCLSRRARRDDVPREVTHVL
jgi:hypothetical protein